MLRHVDQNPSMLH